jgi:hypothetical protein
MSVDTRKVAGRRTLHFANLDEVLADVERLAQTKARTLGNWSAGQVLKHLALTMNSSIDGFAFRAPWMFRVLGFLGMKHFVLRRKMPPGFRLPEAGEKALVPPPCTFEEGVAAIRQAIQRQRTEEKRSPNPVLGPLTRDEWELLHCQHAALHLSFLVPEG